MAPVQYRLERPNLRRVPTLLRPEQQRQHRMSTIKSQISTRTCDSNVRTRDSRRGHHESTYRDDSIDDDDDKVCDGCHDSGDDVADGGDDGALGLMFINCPLKFRRHPPSWKERIDSKTEERGRGYRITRVRARVVQPPRAICPLFIYCSGESVPGGHGAD